MDLVVDVMAIAAVTVAVFNVKERNRVAELSRSGFCSVCSGSGREKCTLCYGRGSIAKPGYINVADPANRAHCKRCDGSGSYVCRSCAGGGQKRRDGVAAAPTSGRRSARSDPCAAGNSDVEKSAAPDFWGSWGSVSRAEGRGATP